MKEDSVMNKEKDSKKEERKKEIHSDKHIER